MSVRLQDIVVGGLLVVLVGVAGLAAVRIASDSAFNSHPDEAAHVDAFCYFKGRWWPPDLNTDGLLYSGYGWSRVYTREVVYIVYGNIYDNVTGLRDRLHLWNATGHTEQEIQATSDGNRIFLPLISVYRLVDWTCWHDNFNQFRYMNVALYMLTLTIVIVAGRHDFWTIALFVAMVSIPQITYIYAYANSDAWGLSFSLFLLLYSLHLSRRSEYTALGAIGLGALTGLVLVTKKPYWLTIPFAYLFLVDKLRERMSESGAVDRWRIMATILLLLVTIGVVAGPLVSYYPWTQGDFAAGEMGMREIRAFDGYRPSNPTAWGLHLAARDQPFRVVWADPIWWGLSTKSFYAMFGILAISVPDWIYATAGAITLFGLAFTLYALTTSWHRIPVHIKIVLAAAPLFIALNIMASLYNSWTIDYQAQGRYLHPSLLPLTFLWAGLYEYEPAWMQKTHWILLAVFCLVGVFALWTVAVDSPKLVAI